MPIIRIILVLVITTSAIPASWAQEQHRFEFSQYHMAVPVRIVLYAQNEDKAKQASDTAFDAFDRLNIIMSDYEYDSELMQLCRSAGESGQTVGVSDDLWEVLRQSKEFCTNSNGAFDITVSPIVKLWRRAKRLRTMPEEKLLAKARSLVGNELWALDTERQSVQIMKSGLRFDLGGIAKGYATDKAIAVLKDNGIEAALVDAGGDIRVFGTIPVQANNENGSNPKAWNIEIANHGDHSEKLTLNDLAVASSGDLEQHQVFDGKRYSHIIDPRTGVPLTDSGVVTVTAPDATTADALASALSVLKPEEGLELLEKYPGTEAIITREQDGRRQTWKSAGWNP